ncbi:alcohol dehydrogenase [Sesbania bispinosa]|nr:alcohol dehydrogenase [Sesbania bispinosa]
MSSGIKILCLGRPPFDDSIQDSHDNLRVTDRFRREISKYERLREGKRKAHRNY